MHTGQHVHGRRACLGRSKRFPAHAALACNLRGSVALRTKCLTRSCRPTEPERFQVRAIRFVPVDVGGPEKVAVASHHAVAYEL